MWGLSNVCTVVCLTTSPRGKSGTDREEGSLRPHVRKGSPGNELLKFTTT